MREEQPVDKKYIVEVEFNQQQEVILKRLRETGKYGASDAEVIRSAFQEFLEQTRF